MEARFDLGSLEEGLVISSRRWSSDRRGRLVIRDSVTEKGNPIVSSPVYNAGIPTARILVTIERAGWEDPRGPCSWKSYIVFEKAQFISRPENVPLLRCFFRTNKQFFKVYLELIGGGRPLGATIRAFLSRHQRVCLALWQES